MSFKFKIFPCYHLLYRQVCLAERGSRLSSDSLLDILEMLPFFLISRHSHWFSVLCPFTVFWWQGGPGKLSVHQTHIECALWAKHSARHRRREQGHGSQPSRCSQSSEGGVSDQGPFLSSERLINLYVLYGFIDYLQRRMNYVPQQLRAWHFGLIYHI